MHIAQQIDSASCDFEDSRSPSASQRTKLLLAGVAMTSVSALTVAPVVATPTLPEVRVAPVHLSAFQNPLEVWQSVFTGPTGLQFQLETLQAGIATASGNLEAALANPAVQAQFSDIFANLIDPQRYENTLAALPGFGDRLNTAGTEFATQFQEALETLPGVLQLSAGLLAEGQFVAAYGELNLWFLTTGLSDFRGSLLDGLRVPGDFFDTIGLEPLGRILGTSWMVTSAPGAQIAGPGLLSRGVIGNFGRAVLAPQVTAIFQTVEILDSVGSALQAGDYQTAASDLVNAPAKITNAFLNGYVPAFVGDPNGPFPPVPGQPAPGQSFPGFFSSTGTADFFLRQVPTEIATALQFQRPPVPPATGGTSGTNATVLSDSPAGLPTGGDSVVLDVAAKSTPTKPAISPVADTTTPVSSELSGDTTTPVVDTPKTAEPVATGSKSTKSTGSHRAPTRGSVIREKIRTSIRDTIRGGTTRSTTTDGAATTGATGAGESGTAGGNTTTGEGNTGGSDSGGANQGN